ncbi:RAD52 motif-containing protein 1-like [Eubalaena glacialis]|uniref:RAD52 motif-containing protein 1-like n=1 Tax=Eubalaena glacialis TaxID=27606 RepID=UPI002A59DAA5|nr:RAD52 motif-containing protein 1-like [Eubalaena glacialis]
MGTTEATNATIRPLALVRGSVRKRTAPAHARLRAGVCAPRVLSRVCAGTSAHARLQTAVCADKTLRVWELRSEPTAEALQHSLFTVFSQFGLQYSVRVFPNAAVAGPGFYAIIKVYSARDAHGAQKACDQKQLFQTSPVKGRLGTRHKVVRHNTLALNSSRCQELANYYFGFNGWSKRIIKLQDLSNLEERENEDIVTPLQKQSLKFFCALEVVLPSHECRSPGVGMAEEPLNKLEEGSLSFLMKRQVTQKLAIQKAVTDAFRKLLIVLLDPSTENTTSENNTAQNVSEEIISTGNSTLPGGTGPGNTTHRNVSTAHSTAAADNSMPSVRHTNETQWE